MLQQLEKELNKNYLYKTIVYWMFILFIIIMFLTGLFNNIYIYPVIIILLLLVIVLYKTIIFSKEKKFLMSNIDDYLNDDFRRINSIFVTDKGLVSCSKDDLNKFLYNDIKRIDYTMNIWEVTRPGYKGEHYLTVYRKNDDFIKIQVKDKLMAQKLCDFIFTKNNAIELVNIDYNKTSSSLVDIVNYEKNTRF